MDFILTILDPSELDFAYNRDWIYNRSRQEKESSTWQGQKGKLEKMFDCLFADSRGRARILDWFRPHAIAYVSDTVSNEMDMVKEALWPLTSEHRQSSMLVAHPFCRYY
ncbi:hypothetical protein BDR07DRAFT_1377528 [Suillus spraguei]|nr:hypothetical protein BDR07DRAFT_1377528 [Suillus spraguei]